MADAQPASLDQWLRSAPERFNPELSGGLDAVLQIHVTGPEQQDFSCAVARRMLTVAHGTQPSPSLTGRGDAAHLMRLFAGNNEVLNSLIEKQEITVTPNDSQLLMWFVLIFRHDPDAALD